MMTIVVGYLPAKGGRASLDLAAVLARSGSAEPVAVVTVVPQHWATPSLAKVDAEFAAWAHQQGEAALDQARQYVAGKWPDVQVTFHQTTGRSVPSALRQACEDLSGDLLVLGSSTDGRVGQIIVGSTATPLLHSSEVPVAIAPRGYRARKGLHPRPADLLVRRHRRRGRPADRDRADGRPAGLPAADRHLRGPRPHHVPAGGRPARRGRRAGAVARTGAGRAGDGRCPAERRWTCCPAARRPRSPPAAAGARRWTRSTGRPGRSWSSDRRRVGHLARVFLGSGAIKIVRYSPVPVVVVPAAVAAELAEAVEAEPTTAQPDAG